MENKLLNPGNGNRSSATALGLRYHGSARSKVRKNLPIKMLNQILRPVASNVVRRGVRAYHPPAEFKQTTMNDLPVPQGSWQANYDAKQKKYNLHLLFGIASVIGTIAVARATGTIYLNWAPPTPKE